MFIHSAINPNKDISFITITICITLSPQLPEAGLQVHLYFNFYTFRIWDFTLGRSCDHDETASLDIGYGANEAGFMIKNYDELIKETSLANTKVLEDIYDMNCSSTHEDVSSSGVRHLPSQNIVLAQECLPYLERSLLVIFICDICFRKQNTFITLIEVLMGHKIKPLKIEHFKG
ncbi:hypothetical protein ACLOJK_019125 [Asimina triloba]